MSDRATLLSNDFPDAAAVLPHPHVTDRMLAFTLGLSEVLRLLKESNIKAERIQEGSEVDGPGPPLSAYTTDVLLGLGAAITDVMVGDLEKMAGRISLRDELIADHAEKIVVAREGA